MVVDGRLRRAFLDGAAGVPAFLDDHAFLAQGLLDLYEATFDVRWLEAAVELSERLEALFGDPQGGAWFSAAATTSGSSRARSRPTTAPSPPARPSRS